MKLIKKLKDGRFVFLSTKDVYVSMTLKEVVDLTAQIAEFNLKEEENDSNGKNIQHVENRKHNWQ